MSKAKTRSVVAKVIGPIPSAAHSGALWKVRLKVPRLPFYLDSSTLYGTLAEAEAEAEKWRRKKIVVTVTR
jgi:hypothetical protein